MDVPRPFYDSFAWAYDLLITDPVEPWVDAVEAAIDAHGLPTPARILDAGCGTGRHAAEFARRGHAVTLIDGSHDLLHEAKRRLPNVPAVHVQLENLGLTDDFDAVVCRGVLNDVCIDTGPGRAPRHER